MGSRQKFVVRFEIPFDGFFALFIFEKYEVWVGGYSPEVKIVMGNSSLFCVFNFPYQIPLQSVFNLLFSSSILNENSQNSNPFSPCPFISCLTPIFLLSFMLKLSVFAASISFSRRYSLDCSSLVPHPIRAPGKLLLK